MADAFEQEHELDGREALASSDEQSASQEGLTTDTTTLAMQSD